MDSEARHSSAVLYCSGLEDSRTPTPNPSPPPKVPFWPPSFPSDQSQGPTIKWEKRNGSSNSFYHILSSLLPVWDQGKERGGRRPEKCSENRCIINSSWGAVLSSLQIWRAAHQPIRNLVKASPCSPNLTEGTVMFMKTRERQVCSRENLLRVWVFSEWRWRQGHHIRMCPTQRTCLRPESSPHLVISPAAVTPGRGAHSNTPAERERPAVTLQVSGHSRESTPSVCSHPGVKHCMQHRAPPGPHPEWGAPPPCPPQCRPQFLTSSGSAIHFGQKDKWKGKTASSVDLGTHSKHRKKEDHLLPVPSRPDGTLQRTEREHWALLETSPASGLSLQSLRTTTVAAPRGNTYTTYQFISIPGSHSHIAIWIHHQLGVAVQVDEAFEVPMMCNEICHQFHLHFWMGMGSMIHVRARVPTGSRSCGEWPKQKR